MNMSQNANNLQRIPNIEESLANARFHDRTDFQSKNITRSDKIPGHNHSKENILSENHFIPSFPVNGITKTSYRKNTLQNPNNHSSHLGGNDNHTRSGIEFLNQTEKKISFQSKVPKSESTSNKLSANLSNDRNLLENTSFENSSNHTDKFLPNTNHLSEQSLESSSFRHSYSHENNLSENNHENHLPIKNQNQKVAVPDVEQKSNKDDLALQTCRAVKTSKIDYKIHEWKRRGGYCWGWTLEPIDPSHHFAIIPSCDSKNCSVSAKDIGHAKRKHDESNCSVSAKDIGHAKRKHDESNCSVSAKDIGHAKRKHDESNCSVSAKDIGHAKRKHGESNCSEEFSGLLEVRSGQDSARIQASAKEKTCINLPSISKHIKVLPMNKPEQIDHSLSVNNKCATSRDLQILNALQHSQLSAIKPSPSRNSIRKSVCDKRNPTIDESTMEYISSKKDRKPVYSGKKLTQDVNVDVNDTTKKLLMLEQCEPLKLKKMEEQNKDLSNYTNPIWEKFCRRDFGDKITNNFGQLWKDIYWRTYEEHENKLKAVTANIVNGIAKAPPERQIKLMDVNSHNPEKRLKKQKTEDPVKSESSGSDSSSPKYNNQKFMKDVKPVKKAVAPLMFKAKKMAAITRRR